ncbi:MAG: hypothetical protein ACI90U_002029 [Pseudomonadales bacterium]
MIRFSPNKSRLFSALQITSVLILLSACNSMPQQIKNLGKSDIDFVIDAHVQEQIVMIESLTRKLYIRNPNQLALAAKSTTVDKRIFSILGSGKTGTLPTLKFSELNNLTGVDAINLGLTPLWQGDKVFAVMVGLAGMLKTSYNSQTEFYMLDSLDQQALYNSARNIEILNWKISNRKGTNGAPLLLTDHHDLFFTDTSFDRLFTRMTAVQDMMAKIVASKNDRGINTVVYGIA